MVTEPPCTERPFLTLVPALATTLPRPGTRAVAVPSALSTQLRPVGAVLTGQHLPVRALDNVPLVGHPLAPASMARVGGKGVGRTGPDDYIGTGEAAKLLAVTPGRIRQLALS